MENTWTGHTNIYGEVQCTDKYVIKLSVVQNAKETKKQQDSDNDEHRKNIDQFINGWNSCRSCLLQFSANVMKSFLNNVCIGQSRITEF